MAEIYSTVGGYVLATRYRLQDLISPFRYADSSVIGSLNSAIFGVRQLRPDIFLDLKYKQPLTKGDIRDGSPDTLFSLSDVVYLPPPNNYMVDPTQGTYVAVPSKFIDAVVWYMSGQLQLFDVTDTADQRAEAFMQKFTKELLSVAV